MYCTVLYCTISIDVLQAVLECTKGNKLEGNRLLIYGLQPTDVEFIQSNATVPTGLQVPGGLEKTGAI